MMILRIDKNDSRLFCLSLHNRIAISLQHHVATIERASICFLFDFHDDKNNKKINVAIFSNILEFFALSSVNVLWFVLSF